MAEKKTIRLEIVSAEKMIFEGDVDYIEVQGGMGKLGLAPGHTPLLTSIKPGDMRVLLSETGEDEFFYMSGGMLEVQPYVVTALADVASRADDLDEAVALQAKEKAENALSEKLSKIEYSKAMAELAEAAAQLRAIKRIRNKT